MVVEPNNLSESLLLDSISEPGQHHDDVVELVRFLTDMRARQSGTGRRRQLPGGSCSRTSSLRRASSTSRSTRTTRQPQSSRRMLRPSSAHIAKTRATAQLDVSGTGARTKRADFFLAGGGSENDFSAHIARGLAFRTASFVASIPPATMASSAAPSSSSRAVNRFADTPCGGQYRWRMNVRRGFCAECGSSVFFDQADLPKIAFCAGSVDEPTNLRSKRPYLRRQQRRLLHDGGRRIAAIRRFAVSGLGRCRREHSLARWRTRSCSNASSIARCAGEV